MVQGEGTLNVVVAEPEEGRVAQTVTAVEGGRVGVAVLAGESLLVQTDWAVVH